MRVKLGEVCEINMGQSPDSSTYNEENIGLPFFQGNADFGEYFPKVRIWCSQPVKIALPNDILISVRAPIGALNIANVQCCIGRGLAALTVNKQICEHKYLWYALGNKIDELNRKGTGSTFKAINKKILSETEILLPPITEQRKISAVLDKVCDLIALRRKQLERLDLMVKARFVEMFGDTIKNTYGWNQQYLSDITLKIGSGATPKGGKESYCLDGITFIRSMNVYDGRFEYKDLAYINEAQAKSLNNVIVCKNDVFINITGASVARSCIVPDEVLPARVNQHVAIIRCMEKEINPIFLNNMFINENFKKHLLAIGESGGATRQAITKQQLESLHIIVPPLDLQEGFASFVTEIDKLKLPIQRSLDTLEVLKKSLMQEYFGQGV